MGGVTFKAKIGIHHVGVNAAAVGVHIVPDVGMNAVVMVGFPLVQWDIIRQQRQKRGNQAGHTELTDKVSFAGVADSNAGGSGGPQHDSTLIAGIAEIAVHDHIAALRYQRQKLRPAGWMNPYGAGIHVIGRKGVAQAGKAALVHCHSLQHSGIWCQRNGNLAAGLDGNGITWAAEPEIHVILPQGLIMPLHGVNDLCQLGIVNGGSVQTGNEMLYRKRNGQHTRTGAIRLEICCKRINLFLKICQWGLLYQ